MPSACYAHVTIAALLNLIFFIFEKMFKSLLIAVQV